MTYSGSNLASVYESYSVRYRKDLKKCFVTSGVFFWTIVCDKTLLQANPVSVATFLPVQLHPSLYRKPSQLVSENNNDKSRTLCKLVFCPCHHNMPKARFDVVLILLRVLLS